MLVLLLQSVWLLAQTALDSADYDLWQLPNDTAKVNALNQRGIKLKNSEPKRSIKLGNAAVDIASKINDTKGEAEAHNIVGMAMFNSGDYNAALKEHQISRDLFVKINEKLGAATALFNMGNVFLKQGDMPGALNQFLEAAKICEAVNDKPKLAKAYNNIAVLHRKQGNLESAIEYNFKALGIRMQINDQQNISSSYNNIGSLFWEKKEFEKAIPYYEKAITYLLKNNDKKGLAVAYNNIGIMNRDMNRFEQALPWYEKAYKVREEIGDKSGMAISLVDIGTVMETRKRYDEAITYHTRGLKLAEEIGDKDIIKAAHIGLASAYSGSKKYQQAFEQMKLHDQIKDSLNNAGIRSELAEMQTKYETEKKENEIKLLNQEKQLKDVLVKEQELELERSKLIQIALGIAVLVILLAGLLVYNRYRTKQQLKLQELLLKQQELRNKAIIETEEKERIRIAKDLHDGVGQQLSALKMNMSAYESKQVDLPAKDSYDALVAMLDESIKELRTVSHNMMPNALLRSGLGSAVRDFINKIASTGLLKIDLNIVGLNERLESTTETVLYRVLQEIVSNIVKHAEASEISIQLIKHPKHLNIMVEDNGKGFDTNRLNEFSGIGLKNIISRIQFLNGQVEFDSAPGRGTTITIDIPINA